MAFLSKVRRATHRGDGRVVLCALALLFVPGALSSMACSKQKPARHVDRCDKDQTLPCLTAPVCQYDAARGCEVCRWQ